MGLWRKIKNVFGIGDVEAENNEFSSEKILDNKNENGVLKLNQVENFLKDKKIDKKWFPYRCQRLSEKLKDYYVLSMDEFKDVVSKSFNGNIAPLPLLVNTITSSFLSDIHTSLILNSISS